MVQSGIGGKRRPGSRYASFSFDRSNQCSLFAAYKSTCTEANLYLEAEVGFSDPLAEQAQFLRLPDRNFQPLTASGYSARQ